MAKPYDRDEVLRAYRSFVRRGAVPTILIGSDSHEGRFGSKKRRQKFVTAIGLYQNSIAHRFMLMWRRVEFLPLHHVHGVPHRMLEETLRTLAVAEELAVEVDRGDFVLGLDINNDAAHPSNAMLTQCVAMCRGQGFPNVRWKPNALITCAADRWAK